MINLNKYLEKNVEIIDNHNKKWQGFVCEYNADDDFCDYQGESIDVRMFDTNQLFCFGITDIKEIKILF